MTAQGAQVNVTTAQIVAALGARVPSSATAQTTFKMAFILVVPNGWTTPAFSVMDLGLATPRPTDVYIRDNLLDGA